MTTEHPTHDELVALVDSLTLDEQVTLLAGADFWHTVAIPRVGIPSMRVSDGPVGARGTEFNGGPESLAVPCGTALAATWDPELVGEIGGLLGREARAKGARILLAPTVNLHRTPVGGRNFECMSEDPYLTSRLAVAYVDGLQAEGVGSCIKHYVGNDTEFERNSIDSRVDERTLRELYLRPFEAAVTEAGVASIMTAYNRVNGPFAADSAELVTGVLRDEWGFDGLVMSDWFGLHSTVEGIEAGLDLEMPGPTIHRGAALVEAVEQGRVEASLVRRASLQVLTTMARLGAFADGEPGPETSRHDDADVARIRSAAAAGTVLLRNEPDGQGRRPLPLDAAALQRIAVIGPNAAVGQIMGGGSAHVTPTSVAHPLAAIREFFERRGAEVVAARGAVTHKRLPSFDPAHSSEVTVEYFAHPDDLADPAAAPVHTATMPTTHLMWTGDPTDQDPATPQFGLRASVTFTPPESGAWSVSLNSTSDATLSIDGRVVIDNADQPIGGSFFGLGKNDMVAKVELDAGQTYSIVIELRRLRTENALTGLNAGAYPPIGDDLIGEAERAAADADVSIVVVGTNDDWETEGYDRDELGLPGTQDELISRVARVSRRTIVVVNAGSPVTMPWLDAVDAVVMCWFPGQEMGHALVDVLTGAAEPAGRLPVSFPARLEDTPAFEHHPGRNGVADYREGRLIGYRWYDTVGREPLFPFGFGLGYADITIDTAAWLDPRTIRVTLTNRGALDGSEVVQVYAAITSTPVADEPRQQLVGFAKVALGAGESGTADVTIDERAGLTWSVDQHAWVPIDGPLEFVVGRSSRDAAVRLPVAG